MDIVASAPAAPVMIPDAAPAPTSPAPVAATPAPSQPLAPAQQAPAAPQMPAPQPVEVRTAQSVQPAPLQQQSAPSPSGATPPAAPSAPLPVSGSAPAGQPVQLSSGLRMAGASDQTRVVINNTLNDVIVRYTVDLDIAVSNFTAQTGIANVGGVATQGIMTQSLLGSLR